MTQIKRILADFYLPKQPLIQRGIACILGSVGGLLLLAFFWFLPAHARRPGIFEPNLPPVWVEFPLTYDIGLHVDIYEHYIVWSQEDSDTRPSCILTNLTATEFPLVTSNSMATLENSIQPDFAPPTDMDICLMDARTAETTHATNNDSMDSLPRIDGDWIVFTRGHIANQFVVAKNLITSQEIVLPRYALADIPNIHNNTIVYRDYSHSVGGEIILAYNLTTQALITISSCYSFCVGSPDIYSGTIVWHQNDSKAQDYNILGYELMSQTYFTISDKAGDEMFPRIDGDVVVWEWQGNIYGYNLSSGERLTITEAAGIQTQPTVSGNLVVWADWPNGNQPDIYAFDISTNEEYQITNDERGEWRPAVWGDLIGYDRGLEGAAAARRMTEFSFTPLFKR